jgi:YD repeat-containing protein
MTNITYSYDSTSGGNYGKGKRTSMSDALGTNSTTDKYDNRGRLIQEIKTIDSVPCTTSYTYDGADRIVTTTYPTNEIATSTYNGRGLPNTLSGSVAGNLVTGTFYNFLGQITELNLGNSTKTTLGYYGTGGTYDTTGGYYGRIWEIKTTKQPGGTPVLQDVKHVWDPGGNLTQRQNLVSSETENFSYDFLDRLTGVTGAYTESYAYNQIGNLTSKNGTAYTYGDANHKHAVTQVGTITYTYDANGNMLTGDGRTIVWDVENRPFSITKAGVTTTFVYDGDGNLVKQIVGSTIPQVIFCS